MDNMHGLIGKRLARRNLTHYRKFELTELRAEIQKVREEGKRKQVEASRMTNQDLSEKNNKSVLSNTDKTLSDNKPINTRKEIAKELKVGTGTIARMQYINARKDQLPEKVMGSLTDCFHGFIELGISAYGCRGYACFLSEFFYCFFFVRRGG